MSRHTVGWAFVGAQIALLVLLVVSPSGDDWSTPGWLMGLGWLVSVLGVVIAVAAGLRLGAALTPTPVPTDRGDLTTHGLYRYVRHPIYTGVLAVVLGIVLRSGSTVTALIGLALLAFFTVKARWEEGQLRDAYLDYAAYAARTPRFVPLPRFNPAEDPNRS